MVNPKSLENLRPANKENAAARGALGGTAKKGSKHITTWIQELAEDDSFTASYMDGYQYKELKGVPIKALVRVAFIKALQGDKGWAEWLAKYGYSQKVDLNADIKGDIQLKWSDE